MKSYVKWVHKGYSAIVWVRPICPELLSTTLHQEIIFHNPQGIYLGREVIDDLASDKLDAKVRGSLKAVVAIWKDVAPHKHGKDAADHFITQLLEKYGDAYANDEDINGGDMVEWIGSFIPFVRSAWLGLQRPDKKAP